MSGNTMFPTTLPELLEFFITATSDTIAFFLSYFLMVVLIFTFVRLPIMRRIVPKEVAYIASAGTALFYLFCVLIFIIDDETKQTPTAPTVMWGIL